jgi:hypothetical protein
MSRYDTDIALRKTVADYCRIRDRAIAAYRSALRLHATIRSDLRAAGLLGPPPESEPRAGLEAFIRNLDASFWRLLFDATGLARYMDDQARREFENGLRDTAPPFEEATIRATLIGAASCADAMFARGLFNLFATRSQDHRTNTRAPFALPRKVVWADMIDVVSARLFGHLSLSYDRLGKLDDLDRIFRTLAGLDFVPRRLESALQQAFRTGSLYEDELFRVRGFKSGTLHVWLLREDLVAKANLIIAAYAGAALPDARAA